MKTPHPNYPGALSTDADVTHALRDAKEIGARARALELLNHAGIPYVVGGAYAFCEYTGIYRDTKDLDLFPRKDDALRALEVLAEDGWRTERTDENWIYKAFNGEYYVDLIFSSGNGVAQVDDEWFTHGRPAEVMGHQVLIAPAEELLWSKAFVLERERYDGSDVIHLLHSAGRGFDWKRLLRRFDRYWEVLLSHLLLFRFTYPSERSTIPDWVMTDLLWRTVQSIRDGDWGVRICRGNLLSRVNYVLDIERWGYLDGRAWDERDRARGSAEAEGSELDAASSGGR